jgi:hypothetical protein
LTSRRSKGLPCAITWNDLAWRRFQVLYVNKVGSDGWLQALANNSNERVSLFKYAQVADVQSRGGRNYFKVMEGVAKGRPELVYKGSR